MLGSTSPPSRAPFRHRSWLRLIRPGDFLVLGAAIAAIPWLAQNGGEADTVVIRAGGNVFATASLTRNQRLEVPGPLGISVVEIANGKVRVAEDPGPRQLCVHQGWLERAGESALCLPNQISIELTGPSRRYDSLNY